MLSLLISLLAGTLVTVLLLFVFPSLHYAFSILLGTLVFAGVYAIVLRQVMLKINAAVEVAQKDLAANRTEKAIRIIEDVQKKFGPWQFYVKQQMNSQIGSIHYLKRDFSKSFEYLNQGFGRHWVGMAMLAICYMKRTQNSKMIETFEKAVTLTRKEPLLWSLYAFCLEKTGERDKAVKVMERGLKKTKGDERMEENLKLLQDGKKMKMQPYGDLWFQFHLEKTGTLMRLHTKAIQGRRKMVRR
jgi:tetratricopeptide (TPR) repeat protein